MAKTKGYVSKGNVGKNTPNLKAVKRDRTPSEIMMIKLDAWKKEKNPWITISTQDKNKPFKRVRANDYWGSPKASYYMGKSDATETV